MWQREDWVRLRHMLDSAQEAANLVHSKRQEDLARDRVLTPVLLRLLEILGEAASRVTPEFKGRYLFIPWRQLVGLRNRLIYGYDSVDNAILRNILTTDLPPLVVQLESALRSEPTP